MIRYTKGNLLDAQAEALVNTVNEVGVMGRGVALMFSEAFPENTRAYQQASRQGEVRVGRMFVTKNRDLMGPRWIINFPTKKHWRHPSKLEWVREGLKDLARVVNEHRIKSIALPPLGCGNGGLLWGQVRREIENELEGLAGVQVIVYEPTSAYQNTPKRAGLEELTPARALVAELVRRYCVVGLECTNLEVQKLAWFLQRVIRLQGLDDPLDMQFSASKYGPYADRLRHLLDGLDGSYLHCERRLSDAGPYEPIWFEDAKRETVADYFKSGPAKTYVAALKQTKQIIDGFESPLGMELLSTVDWLLAEEKCEPALEEIKRGLQTWRGGKTAARRKLELFDDRLLGLALERLKANQLTSN